MLHVEEYSIIPHRKRSPLALQQHGYADLGICLQQSGDAIPLATYSLMHGCEIGLSDLKYVADFLLKNNGSPALKAKASVISAFAITLLNDQQQQHVYS